MGVTPKARFIPAGGRTTFTVVFKRTGRFQYVCTIGEHAIKGMQGVFVVKP
jgi:plastocyanin